MPTSNLLRELRDFCHVEVVIIAGQVESIPEAVRPGLSEALARSVPVAVEEVLKLCHEPCGNPARSSSEGDCSTRENTRVSGFRGVTIRKEWQ